MKNFLQPGDTLDLIAPGGGVVSGAGVLIGSLFTVATATRAAGEVFAGKKKGVFTLPKLVTDVMAAGAKVNWNDTNDEWQLATTDLDDAAALMTGTLDTSANSATDPASV